MIIDKKTQLWDSAALSGDAVSTNSYDTGSVDVAQGEPLYIVLNVEVAADNTTGNETYQFNILEDGDSALGSPTILQEVLFTNAMVAAGALAAGKIYAFPIMPGRLTERYLGMGYDGEGTTPTITVSAHVEPHGFAQLNKLYPDAIVISG